MLKLVAKYNVSQSDLQKYMSLIVSNGDQPVRKAHFSKNNNTQKTQENTNNLNGVQQAQLSKLLASKNVLRLTPVTIATTTPKSST